MKINEDTKSGISLQLKQSTIASMKNSAPGNKKPDLKFWIVSNAPFSYQDFQMPIFNPFLKCPL